jgi:hypothetical protein
MSFFYRNWLEFGDVNLDKISILCCLNCFSECINGFNVLKKPGALKLFKLSQSNHSSPNFEQNQKEKVATPKGYCLVKDA